MTEPVRALPRRSSAMLDAGFNALQQGPPDSSPAARNKVVMRCEWSQWEFCLLLNADTAVVAGICYFIITGAPAVLRDLWIYSDCGCHLCFRAERPTAYHLHGAESICGT
ncbi:hypothetical protein EJB05_44001 [Eragrostis curvula]|uniref:Uncharacterized protein n=1 Tax=Eragrostis curvula TaxID=38414 RepID=A0A5J9TGU2_9POAL|nr:hypothetical protein EJB05_44001 [Eragrostis curvula]